MQKLIDLTTQWADDKGILSISDPKPQMLKVVAEVGELADDLGKGNDPRGELGDVLVTLICLCGIIGTTPKDCLELAYNKISKRKGQMVNGIFVKEGDSHSNRDSFTEAGDI